MKLEHSFTSCLNRRLTTPVFQQEYHISLVFFTVRIRKKCYVPMSLVATTRSSFLPRQTPTDRSDNNLPSQRLSPPCQEQVEPQFLHFPFFSSSCLRSPLMHLLRKYSEKLGIPGQSPELHSHALRDTTTRNKDRSPSLTVKNP